MIELCNIPDCEREIQKEFCEQHLQAQNNLEKAFQQWQHAFGEDFTRDQYYSELLDNENVKTGEWVKDIILYELDEDTS